MQFRWRDNNYHDRIERRKIATTHESRNPNDRARRKRSWLRFCHFSRIQSVSPERCLLVLDVRERQDTAKELATAHDTPEARESEQKRSHTTVNVDPNRIYIYIYRYNTVRLIEQTPINAKYSIGRLQILLSRRKTFAVIASGGNCREDHRRFSSSSRPPCVSSPISHHYKGIRIIYIYLSLQDYLILTVRLFFSRFHVGNLNVPFDGTIV